MAPLPPSVRGVRTRDSSAGLSAGPSAGLSAGPSAGLSAPRLYSALFACLLGLAGPAAHAGRVAPRQTPPPSTDRVELVHRWFRAVAAHDLEPAVALTLGCAAERTREVLRSVDRAARDSHARIELRLGSLSLTAAGPDAVEARFSIDVVGRRWLFSRVARRLVGEARFRVDALTGRIVGIDGALGGLGAAEWGSGGQTSGAGG